MFSFLLWCILLVMCWPLALLALVLYPLVWLVLLPFRIVGIAVGGVLELVRGIIFLPADFCAEEFAPRDGGAEISTMFPCAKPLSKACCPWQRQWPGSYRRR